MNKMQILLRQQTMVKTLGIMMVFAVANIMFVSCADESIAEKTNTLDKVKGKESIELAQSTVSITADAGMQLPDVSKPIDPTIEPTSRAVSLNEKYMPLAEGSELKARVFIVKAPKNARKKIGWSDAIDPKDIILGAGELEWNIEQTMTGGGVRLYSTKEVTFHWLKGNKKVNINKGEDWYICGIIGGEYNKEYDEARKDTINNDKATCKLAERLYHFYVDFDPNHSPKHNTIDSKGHIQVTAPFTTGWTKLDIKEDNKISLHQWNFKPMGTLLHFRIKRDEKLVPLEACRYTFASSQLTANGGFLMMPQTMIRTKDDDLKEDYTAGVDCEIRPWTNSIVGNFYWNYVDDMRPHFNNTSNQTGYEESKHANDWGPAIYEYRYTFDANAMRKNNKTGYDDFYVWGMPVPHTEQVGTSQMTAERGGFMLGCKQKKGRKYDYANEWLYAAKERELKSGEYNIFDFKQKQGKAFLVELGVCRPRYSTMENKKLKYPWANPLERLAVTNSRTESKGFQGENTQHVNENGKGYVYDWSVKGGQFKMRFVKKDRRYLPEGYHVPSGEDFGIVFPNNIKGTTKMELHNDFVNYPDIKSAPNPYYELYSPNEDDPRDFIVASTTNPDENENKYWQTRPLFYSYYMHNPNNPLEFYAIRFCGENKEASKAENRNHSIIGNRYRCVYRWRVLDAGDNKHPLSNDKQGMRIVVQSRWIGHANVSVKDIIDERWWGKCSTDNPLYKADCYRVLPAVGYPYVISGLYNITYFSRTRWLYKKGYGSNPAEDDDDTHNISFCYRAYNRNGFVRKHWESNKQHYGVRLVTDISTDEFGPLAPRNSQRDMYEGRLIHRPEDDGKSDWTYPVKKK